MMPFVYLLNGAPVFQPPGGGGNWTVNNLVVTGTLNVSGAATFSSSGSFGGNLTANAKLSVGGSPLGSIRTGILTSTAGETGCYVNHVATSGTNFGVSSVFDGSAGATTNVGFWANMLTGTTKVAYMYGNVSPPTDGGNYIFWASSALQVTSTGNTTLGGNLTVSGTGTSSMAGRLDIANSVSENTAFQAVNSSASGYGAFIQGGDSTRYCFKVMSQAGALMINTLNTGSSLGGNTLLGTTTDSANGRLQLATHSTSAGGIGFGTDTSLWRSSAGALKVTGTGTNFLLFSPDASHGVQIYVSGADSVLRLTRAAVHDWDLAAGSNFDIKLDGVSALSFDGNKNATFAGTIATQGGTASTPASASATGTAGTIKWDASYIYVCTATNTWKRAAIATW